MTDVKYNFLFKILVIGDSGVGKTALIKRYCQNTFDNHYESTVGVDFMPKILNYNNKTIKLQLWDTAGQEKFMNITAAYYRNTQGIIIVYDVNNKDTLDNVDKWFTEVNTRTRTEPPVVLLVGNKKEEDTTTIDIAKSISEKYGAVKTLECSAKNNVGVEEVFDVLVKNVMDKFGNVEVAKTNQIVLNEKKKSGCC
ncbi:Sphingomyelin phosphodiesterase [Entamoeba marina]